MPYILLGILALILLLVAWLRSPTPLRLWTYLTTGGAVTIGDLFSTGIFDMYIYRPGFLPKIPDKYLGVLIAECLFVPAYYTFLSLFSPRRRYVVYALGVIPVLLLELLFLRLGVYFHRSWSFWHSIGAFLAYGLVAAYGAGSFERKGYTPRHRLILIAGTVYYAMNLWGLLPFGVLRLASMRLYMVESAELDHVLSSLLLHAVPFTVTGIAGTWFRWNRRPLFLVAVGFGFTLWIMLLEHWGIWTRKAPWNVWLEGLCFSLTMAAFAWVDGWFTAHLPRKIPPWEPPAAVLRPKARS